jgi:hypothetical protein
MEPVTGDDLAKLWDQNFGSNEVEFLSKLMTWGLEPQSVLRELRLLTHTGIRALMFDPPKLGVIETAEVIMLGAFELGYSACLEVETRRVKDGKAIN